ncbi:MAG: hypothetical protein OXF25_08270 [Cyanobacteria bacterium MAG CAR3_bin_5]|nr:hypothetical protein [Cyanobacteria bacterium MAG CAR4_bin_6]MCY4174040.1 hypothetical protein [Cyanobacteria bacterium MAG CAR3_bin_5]MCY4236393.1 hypothetical protein [Cyanobacteria bacterium MAG CAR2_bin_4]
MPPTGSCQRLFRCLRTPTVLLVLALLFYFGHLWTLRAANTPLLPLNASNSARLYWLFIMAQLQYLVLLCTMPGLVLRRLTMPITTSRFVSFLVVFPVGLLGVAGLIHLQALGHGLILAAALLLARLDLTEADLYPAPARAWLITNLLSLLMVSLGAGLGSRLPWPHPPALPG